MKRVESSVAPGNLNSAQGFCRVSFLMHGRYFIQQYKRVIELHASYRAVYRFTVAVVLAHNISRTYSSQVPSSRRTQSLLYNTEDRTKMSHFSIPIIVSQSSQTKILRRLLEFIHYPLGPPHTQRFPKLLLMALPMKPPELPTALSSCKRLHYLLPAGMFGYELSTVVHYVFDNNDLRVSETVNIQGGGHKKTTTISGFPF